MTEKNPALSSLSTEAIVQALEQARKRAAVTEGRIAELEQSIASDKQEARLLEELLALRRGEEPKPLSEPPQGASTPIASERKGGNNFRSPVMSAVVEVLTEVSRPCHVSDLMRILKERSVAIPGAGSQANLISHMRRDDRIVRPSRGMYGLAVWGLSNMKPGARKSQRRRKTKRSRKR